MTRFGMGAMICFISVISIMVATPLSAAEPDTPVIERSPTVTGDAWNFSVTVRFAEGQAMAVDVRNDTTYLGNGAVFEIVDFSNSVPPALLGSVTLPSVINGIKVVGNYAYVADYADGLQIVDISNPTAPSVVGAYLAPGWSMGIDVVGSTAYLANSGDGLRIIDVSTPSSPSEISRYDTDGQTVDVEVVGDYAYLAAGTEGLYIIDISVPATPVEVGAYNTSGNYYKLEVSGDYAYMAAYTYGLEVVRVSDPENPVAVVHIPVGGLATSICVDGAIAYLGPGGLSVVDITDPTDPTLVGSLAQPPRSLDIAVSGTRAYVAADYGGVVAYNVALAPSPSIVTTHETGDEAVGIAAVEGVTGNAPGPAASDYMYIAEGNNGIRVIDITTPSNPNTVGHYALPSGRAEDVVIAGNVLLTACSDGFRAINVENPVSPTQLGYYDTKNSAGVAVNGNYAYVAARGYGLYVIDITDPSIPAEAGVYATPGTAWDVVYNAGYAYVADYNSGLTIIDVSTPTAPNQVGAYAVPNNVYSVAVTGNYVYVGSFLDGVYVVDVSIPSAPVEIANINPGSNIRNLFISGNYLYIARSIMGVDVAYINDKVNSPLVGRFDTGDEAYDVFVIGHSVYLADFRDGVWMLEFDPPPTPTFISAFFCEPVDGGVELSWRILSDDVVEGFNIYRSTGSDGNRYIVNTGGVIPPGADRFLDTSVLAGETYEYSLAVVLDDGSEILSQTERVHVGAFELTLNPNYPNPFNPVTTISFALPSNGHVNLAVYDADGRLIRTIVDDAMGEGSKTYRWDGRDENGSPVSSGVYFCRLKTGTRVLTQKMTLIK